MIIQRVNAVYFSPTGTTGKIVKSIASQFSDSSINIIDITLPAARAQKAVFSSSDLLIVGVPVYMGRVPAIIHEWLSAIEAENTPAVCIAVYGNRAYDNALLELQDIMMNCGCRPLAAAAFIGEHSFSSPNLPTAHDRPDANDLAISTSFALDIMERLSALTAAEEIAVPAVPGSYPYNGVTELWNVDFIATAETCTGCGRCAALCPAGAIAADNSSVIDIEKCITCCACIRNCPQNARTIKESPVQDAALRLHNNCAQRREPELFL